MYLYVFLLYNVVFFTTVLNITITTAPECLKKSKYLNLTLTPGHEPFLNYIWEKPMGTLRLRYLKKKKKTYITPT